MSHCQRCRFAYSHRGHGECWTECSHPVAHRRGPFMNILWGCQEEPKPVPEWCPIRAENLNKQVEDRTDFERRCLEHFKAKRAAGVDVIDDNGSPVTSEALFWRAPDGSYGVAAFNVAWIAYQWGYEAGKGRK